MDILKTFQLDNMNFILYSVNVAQKENAEDFVKILFRSLGYDIIKSPNKNGIPDFKVSKGDKDFYVEVKGENDGLRFSQLEWIKNNPDKEVVVFYLNQNNKPSKESIEEDKRMEKIRLSIEAEKILG